MGVDDSPVSSRRGRGRENHEMADTTTSQRASLTMGGKKRKNFFKRHQKPIVIATLILILLFALFMGLGFGGVFNPPTTAAPATTTAGPVPVHPAPDLPVAYSARIECLPDGGEVSARRCYDVGCSYEKLGAGNGSAPACYVNSDLAGYQVQYGGPTPGQATLNDRIYHLKRVHEKALYSVPFVAPQLRVRAKSQSTLNFKFFDGRRERYEVPIPLNTLSSDNLDKPLYEFRTTSDRDTGVQIVRKSTGTVLFDMSLGGLFLEDQFLQITTKLPSSYVYGFGDNRHNTLRHNMDWKTWAMFARDAQPNMWANERQHNLYGVHPFYICVEEDGNAHGVFLLNSNAMEYKFQPGPGLTLRSIGGVLDFHIFMGPTPEEVVQQYTALVGRSFIPPYWGLGFQISRWGFRDLDHVKDTVTKVTTAKIPLDAVYGDIDYMRHRQDFTYDKYNYSGLPKYIEDLHAPGTDMKYVIILDPAIHADAAEKHPGDPEYLPYTDGVERDIFIKWPKSYLESATPPLAQSVGPKGSMLGKVWPDGRSAFPDFFLPATLQWWEKHITDVYVNQELKFDALWLDMNEVSSFDTNDDPATTWVCTSGEMPGNHTCYSLRCPRDHLLENPPYKPMAMRAWINPPNNPEPLLSDKTICMIGETNIKGKIYSQYDVHNLYGYSQAEVTYRVAQKVRGERSFVFSRSTFPGTQKYVGHWGGDNEASFADLRQSIIVLLEYSMFGFSYVGSDICGFFATSTKELCKKWSVVGAFYPFSRNHNGQHNPDQHPAMHEDVAEAAKAALEIRYTLLPYLYTLFYRTHVFGETVSRPVHHVYPKSVRARTTEDQFFWGSCLMISPIVDDVTVRSVFLPETMYDFYDGLAVTGDTRFTWKGPNYVALHLRPGFIIPTQDHAVTTTASRKNPFRLLVVANAQKDTAVGELFWDDGKSIDTYENKNYFKANFTYKHTQQLFSYNVTHSQGDLMKDLRLHELSIYGSDFELVPAGNMVFELNGVILTGDHGYTVTRTDQILRVKGPFLATDELTGLLTSLMRGNFTFAFYTRNDFASNYDCMPEGKHQIATCQARGCIWSGGPGVKGPKCSFRKAAAGSAPAIGYTVTDDQDAEFKAGRPVTLAVSEAASQARPHAHLAITVQAEEHSDKVLRITFTGTREEDPASLEGVPLQYAEFSRRPATPAPLPGQKKYTYSLMRDSATGLASVRVTRTGTDTVLFETSVGPLLFANQFREITTSVPTQDVYGIGEHSRSTFRHSFDYKTWGMFARDQPPGGNQNLYGVHPYVQIVDGPTTGTAYGLLLLNAHAMETTFAKPTEDTQAITYRTIGGNLDFYFIVGETPAEVNREYMTMIGKPYLPPYWALGFQISRYGYDTFANMSNAVERTLRANIPLDVFYGDIDYFEAELGFTISDRFKELPAFVDAKLKDGVRFVTIQDPCIAALPSQEPFVRGVAKKNVFIRWPVGYVDPNEQSYDSIDPTAQNYLLGHVWPGAKTVFVDFFHQDAQDWWKNEVKILHDKLKFSALWIDMNEPASFGTNSFDVWYTYSPIWPWSLECPNTTTDYLDMPPYIPKSLDTPSERISDKTICMSAQQRYRLPVDSVTNPDGTKEKEYNHYDVHNLYGHSQIEPSLEAMHAVTGDQRSFVFSRSTFVGSGARAGHWLGDNSADYNQLAQSVIGMLDFNLFGIPYVGADTCGFFGDSDPQLCLRWMQLGAFYPFFRNHNGKGFKDQDPASYPPETKVAEYSKIAVDRRYSLLPYLYTLLSQSARDGGTVVKSLMEVFYTDATARDIDKQFMWGDALLVTPVLQKDARFVRSYFPKGIWYDWETAATIESTGVETPAQRYHDLPVTLEKIPLHIRGGYAVPMQESGRNTADSSQTPYTIRIAPDRLAVDQTAQGTLFWDGGLLKRDILKPPGKGDQDFQVDIQYDYNAVTTPAPGYMGKVTLTLKTFNDKTLAIPPLDTIRIAGYVGGTLTPLVTDLVITDANGDVSRPPGAGIVVDDRKVVHITGLGLTFDATYNADDAVTVEFLVRNP